MTSNHDRIILVTGATGQQGGAVARHLLANGWKVRALTRDASKPSAQALELFGAEVITGDLKDRASLDNALKDVYGVFSMQQNWGIGSEAETRLGKNLADAAQAANVQHFVYNSVGGADRQTGIPHFESKFAIEQHIRSLGLPATILRPVFFMENFRSIFLPQEVEGVHTLMFAVGPETRLQMIAVDDIGALVALVFEQPEVYLGHAIEIGGDELTLPQVAEALTRVTGQPHRFMELSLEQVRSFSPENVPMFQWFNESGFQAELPAIRAMYPRLKTFERWLQQINTESLSFHA